MKTLIAPNIKLALTNDPITGEYRIVEAGDTGRKYTGFCRTVTEALGQLRENYDVTEEQVAPVAAMGAAKVSIPLPLFTGPSLDPKTVVEAFKLLPDAHSPSRDIYRASRSVEDLVTDVHDVLLEVKELWSREHAEGFRNAIANLVAEKIKAIKLS